MKLYYVFLLTCSLNLPLLAMDIVIEQQLEQTQQEQHQLFDELEEGYATKADIDVRERILGLALLLAHLEENPTSELNESHQPDTWYQELTERFTSLGMAKEEAKQQTANCISIGQLINLREMRILNLTEQLIQARLGASCRQQGSPAA